MNLDDGALSTFTDRMLDLGCYLERLKRITRLGNELCIDTLYGAPMKFLLLSITSLVEILIGSDRATHEQIVAIRRFATLVADHVAAGPTLIEARDLRRAFKTQRIPIIKES
ncbi:MAG TPA: hypothetical protein VGM88_11650 [Kofleriaceae bacterium]|jgi:hypothetical protein